jgi:hypothetical protein
MAALATGGVVAAVVVKVVVVVVVVKVVIVVAVAVVVAGMAPPPVMMIRRLHILFDPELMIDTECPGLGPDHRFDTLDRGSGQAVLARKVRGDGPRHIPDANINRARDARGQPHVDAKELVVGCSRCIEICQAQDPLARFPGPQLVPRIVAH